MAARAVHTISRSRQWGYTLRGWMPGVLLGLLCVGAVLCLYTILPLWQQSDAQGMAPQGGEGVVSPVTYGLVTKGNQNPALLVTVSLAHDNVSFRTHAPVWKGERVHLTYRVGRSGNVYVEDVEPTKGANR